jgi:hypothetical protein
MMRHQLLQQGALVVTMAVLWLAVVAAVVAAALM